MRRCLTHTRPMQTLLHALNIPSVCHSAYTVCTRFDIHQPNLEQCIVGKRKVHSRRPVPSWDADAQGPIACALPSYRLYELAWNWSIIAVHDQLLSTSALNMPIVFSVVCSRLMCNLSSWLHCANNYEPLHLRRTSRRSCRPDNFVADLDL